ncbi:MAG TPA: DUF5701 family protein [Thermomonospora sp.]|nr:DUF5701 family protein [Thermomonospora sp.]
MTVFDAGAEFDRQVATLLAKGYPALAGLTAEEFTGLVAPLRDTAVARGGAMTPPEEGRMPFLLVVTRALAPIEQAWPLTTLHGKSRPGIIDRHYEPGALERFVTTKEAAPPDERAYLLFDVDRGEEFCGAVPNDAMAVIAGRGRTLLTIEEGIALVTQHPVALAKNKCFSLGGSRSGDRRVPAMWISQNAPKLGWCWEGNPHTWLGMASAADRAVI